MKLPGTPGTAAPGVSLPDLKWVASPNFSERGAPVHLVVVHRPVGAYEGAIRTLCDPKRDASAHIVMKPGGKEATQLVPWGKKAWACMAFNSFSDNLEIADECWDGRDPAGLRVAARIVAFRLHKRGLPASWSRDGRKPGFTRHYDLGAIGGGHTDPTTSLARWLSFVAMVKAETRRGGFRAEWGR